MEVTQQKYNIIKTVLFLINFAFIPFFVLSVSDDGFSREIGLGAFLGTNTPTGEDVRDFEQLIGKHVYSVLFYRGLDPAGMEPSELLTTLNNIKYHDGYDTHIAAHVVLEPWEDLSDIANGVYDAQYREIAGQLKDWDGDVRLRFAHEMIEDDKPGTNEWYPWQDHPDLYKAAWKRVVSIFRDEGANNVEFVWCPNHHISDYNVLAKYYPGKDYVDVIGIDGWGYPGLDFDAVFEEIYKAIVEHPEIFGDKDMMLGEFAAMDFDGKAAWIQDAFNKIKDKYTKIREIYWFNINKEQDWRVNSSESSLRAFRDAISDPMFVGHPVGSGNESSGDEAGPQLSSVVTLKLRLTIPAINAMCVTVSKIDNGKYWGKTDCIDFGRLIYDKKAGVFRASSYFVLDIGILSNKGDWIIIHQPTSIRGPQGANLDDHINVVFVTMGTSGEKVLRRSSYGRSYCVFQSHEVPSQWLRIYYGIASGKGDAPGVSPIGLSMPAGNYTGRIVLSLVVK